MISAKDGYAEMGRTHPGKGGRRLGCCQRVVLASLFCAGLCLTPGGLVEDVRGQSVSGPPMSSMMVVLANQSMRLRGDDGPADMPRGRVALANRAVSLSSEPALAADVSRVKDAGKSDPPLTLGDGLGDSEEGFESADEPGSAGSGESRQLALADRPRQPREDGKILDDRLIASISTEAEQARQITVSKDSAVTIDLKMPIDRVETRDPNIADVVRPSPQRIIVVGKGYGTTRLVLYTEQEQRVIDVNVEMNLSVLSELIHSIAPTADVQLRSVNGLIVLRGTVPDSETAQQIAELASIVQGGEVRNQLRVAGVQQTMLRVVVAEVNREAIKELGVNWAMGGSDWSRDFFFANNIGQLNPTAFSSSGLPNLVAGNNQGGQMTYSVAGVGNGAAANVTFGFPRAEFQMFMNALRQNGLSRILAEPNLVAISGQTARFLAGGEVPIPVPQGGATAGAIAIEYHEFGVRLGFTPTVAAGQIIRLHVMSEVSEAVPGQQIIGGFPVFTFNTRRVESTIECGNGQTFALAGLLSEDIRATASKIPGLGDIPVLGALFSSTEYRKANTELVVLVTPQLVEPLDPQMVPPVPGSDMTEPNDFQFFGLQRLEGTPTRMPEPEGVPRDHTPVATRPSEGTAWPSTQTALRGPWGFAESAESN